MLIPEPTARKPRRGLLIPVSDSGVQSRCSWYLGSKGITFLALEWSSLISILRRTVVSNSFDWLTRLFYSFPNHNINGHLKFAFCKQKCCYALAENWKNILHRQEQGQEYEHGSK